MNVGRKCFSNRMDPAATIDSADDFQNSYTYDALNRLTQVGQVQPATGDIVAEKRDTFSYNAIGQFTSIARFNEILMAAAATK